MKNKPSFTTSGFFVLRTPLLPFENFLEWGRDLQAPKATPEDLNRKYQEDLKLLRDRLNRSVSCPLIRDALFIASPNIIERFNLWIEDPDSERGHKVEHVLVRYFSRMTGRATPFGLFAGCSVGKIGDRTRLALGSRYSYRRHTRLDMDYLFALTEGLERDPALRKTFIYRPNSSLYRAAGRIRYVESRLADKQRSYHLVAVEETPHLQGTLNRATSGATVTELARTLVNHEVSLPEAESFIAELIDNQLLVPESLFAASGPEPIHPLIDRLQRNENNTEVATTLDRVRIDLRNIDEKGLGVEAESYHSVARNLEPLQAKVEMSRLIQVDMVKPSPDATLGAAVLEEVVRAVEVFQRLARRPGRDSLSRFRQAFVARYEQRQVPLVEVLDEEIGIGFGGSDDVSPLLKDVVFPGTYEDIQFDPVRQSLLLQKLGRALERGDHEVAINSKELEVLSVPEPLPLPDSFAVQVSIAADSQEALDNGDFRLIFQSLVGPSGAPILGRFCHADEELYREVRNHLRAEEALKPDAVFAEVVHLPEGRVGNVIVRPVMRDHEIPYLGGSGVSSECQIPVTDLHVSVEGEQIKLRSQRLGCEVIPRMTNAHNHAISSLGIYKFLCSLQHQGVAIGTSWDWGTLWSAPFLPRVSYGRLVLSLAQWRVVKEELRTLGEAKAATRFRKVQEWRAERHLPRLVALVDGDNLLLTDLDNALSVDSFVQLVKERDGATLQEMFPDPGQLCAFGPEGRFVHELIIPFVRSAGREKEGGKAKEHALDLHHSPRSFPPGSEWLYIKLYTGTATADHLLREIVNGLAKKLLRSGVVDHWFFIRYGDPDWHIRLRFHGDPGKLRRRVMPAIERAFNPLIENGHLWRIQLDTYEREVERYGGTQGIVLSERIFHVDSEAVLEIIDLLEPGDAGADERWRLVIAGIDLLFSDFGLDQANQLKVMKQTRDAFAREFHVDQNVKGLLSSKFREERLSLQKLFDSGREQDHPLAPGFKVLGKRSERLAPLVSELKTCEEKGQLTTSISGLMPSYIHMFANRLLRAQQREQELVIYDFLTRLYESRSARDVR